MAEMSGREVNGIEMEAVKDTRKPLKKTTTATKNTAAKSESTVMLYKGVRKIQKTSMYTVRYYLLHMTEKLDPGNLNVFA